MRIIACLMSLVCIVFLGLVVVHRNDINDPVISWCAVITAIGSGLSFALPIWWGDV